MNLIEIERKYLVENDDFKTIAFSHTKIVQGYLSTDPERTVRIRTKGRDAFITVKGITSDDGTTRFEWEKSIAYEDALQLLSLCTPYLIEKVRYCVRLDSYVIEVDEFSNDNAGLIMAEIELRESTTQLPTLPLWIGKEVTGIKRFYNSNLITHPFRKWSDTERQILK